MEDAKFNNMSKKIFRAIILTLSLIGLITIFQWILLQRGINSEKIINIETAK
jgi:hypothetical protein